MLRALAFETVRQEHDQATVLFPLVFATHDELVDNDLGAIHEVAELGFPYDECVGVGDGVPVFEPECCVFTEHRVVDREPGVDHTNVVEWTVFSAGVVVDQRGMAVREGAPAAVLTGQPNLGPLGQY